MNDKKDRFLSIVNENGHREVLKLFGLWWFPVDYLNKLDPTTAPYEACLAKCYYERLDTSYNVVGVYVDKNASYTMFRLSDILNYK